MHLSALLNSPKNTQNTGATAAQAQPKKYAPGGQVSAIGDAVGGPTKLGAQGNTGANNLAQGNANLASNTTNGNPGILDPGSMIGGPDIGKTVQGIGDFLSNKFQATAAPIQQGTTVGQINNAYGQAQSGLEQQQNFVNALQAQNGLQNQSQVYNQMQGVANGTGPNPAQAQLAQATGQNVANQAALMAGQRGSSANAGMIARQAAQQGANIQQNAAGQAATLQAQQSLNALNQMGGIAQNQVSNQASGIQGLNNATQNEQNILQGANAGYNANQVNMQNGMNNVNAGVAAGNQNAAGQVMGGIMNMGSSVASMFMAEGGEVGDKPEDSTTMKSNSMSMPETAQLASMQDFQPSSPTGPQSAAGEWLTSNSNYGASSSAPAFQAPQQSDWFSKSSGGKGGGMSMPSMADGGNVTSNAQYATSSSAGSYEAPQQADWFGGASKNVKDSTDKQKAKNAKDSADQKKGSGMSTTDRQYPSTYAQGGNVPALVSPGERYLPPQAVSRVKAGANPLSEGEKIPGKPKHPGNDYRNDTVKKTLRSGGIVIPNEIMQSKNPHFAAMKFVHATIAKSRHQGKKK